jgi:poly-gamma-glutamate synthesis protein (capsule biosynthesis protein)
VSGTLVDTREVTPPQTEVGENPVASGEPLPDPVAVSRRVRRNRWLWSIALVVLIGLTLWWLSPSGSNRASPPHRPPTGRGHGRPVAAGGNPRLDPDWQGDGKAVTFAFGGDVNFPTGSVLATRLADDPATAMGPGATQLLGGVDLSMVNLETALTDGSCPDPQPKQYVFWAPPAAISAFRGAGVTLVTEANNHGEDCGQAGLQMSLAARTQSRYPILGIGQNAAAAFAPFRTTIAGQRVAIIAATQVIDSDLQSSWSATATQPGLASAYDVPDLVHAVEAARKVSDTVVVFLHWGTELDACPNPQQQPLANVLVRAGADIVVGSHAHVLLGGGYLGTAYVDYGLGNFAFYNDPSPTDETGSLVITATGRHIDAVTWRPALVEDEIPVPLGGDAADSALQRWAAARSCTDVTSTPGASLATGSTETSPAPATAVQQLSVDSG